MNKIIKLLALILTLLVITQSFAYANGPLVVKNGKAITYGSRPFLYRYDQGTLGMFSNAQAVTLIEDLFKDWEAVKTAMISFQQDSPSSLDFDVTATNFDSILNSNDLLGYSPIVFDTDGSLLNTFLGSGAGNSVLGLSGPITVSAGPLAGQIAESQAIFNGRFVNGVDTTSDPESTVDSFMGTIIHETGHGIGLDHSQINVEAIKAGSSQGLRDQVPLMFPVAVNDLFLIRRDDASGISLLYPNSSELSSFGSIEGKIFRQDGNTPVLGANVIARNVNDPKLEAVSCVSDFLIQSNGFYKLVAVPPGQYTIELEPIDLSFTGGSGVGPYTNSKSDKSFQNPVSKGYYTGPNKPITPNIDNALIVTVTTGQSIKDANIIASETTTSTSSTSSSSSSTSSSGTPTDINEIEPNDSVDQAQVFTPPANISGNVSKSDSGELELMSDSGASIIISDLFKFTLTQTDSINALLSFSGTTDSDLDLILFNNDGSEILDSSSQNGLSDELISTSLPAGTYILGVGAFGGNASYTLAVSNSNVASSLLLNGPSAVLLSDLGGNKFTITANATGFTSTTMCMVTRSNPEVIKPKVKSFMLSPSRITKNIKFKVPLIQAIDIINSQTDETVTVSVICTNGASDEFDVLLTSDLQKVTSTKKRNWRIFKK